MHLPSFIHIYVSVITTAKYCNHDTVQLPVTQFSGPSTYIYCVVCYFYNSPICKKCWSYVIAYLYTLDDDSERPMDYDNFFTP